MKIRYGFIARALVLLGFGSAVGLTGCSTARAQRNRSAEKSSETTPVADSVTMHDYGEPVRVMYGVPPSQYHINGPLRGERPAPAPAEGFAPATERPAPAEQPAPATERPATPATLASPAEKPE
jgi:hypothetical protein